MVANKAPLLQEASLQHYHQQGDDADWLLEADSSKE
jgi:hypothetical protein